MLLGPKSNVHLYTPGYRIDDIPLKGEVHPGVKLVLMKQKMGKFEAL